MTQITVRDHILLSQSGGVNAKSCRRQCGAFVGTFGSQPDRSVRPVMSKAPGISIKNLSVSFRTKTSTVTALDDVSFDIAPGSFLSIVGPSGCGKTTLLKILSGVLQPTSGTVLFDGEPLSRLKTQGQVGYVFQRPLLLPWRTTLDNVMLTMEVARRGMSRAEREAEARRWLKIAGLQGFEERFPHELSGGMQQRVSICRALAFQPRILLMDEPFAALDEITRETLQEELLLLWAQTETTVVFITHSIPEAVLLSEQIVVMSARPGRVLERIPVPFERPRTEETRERPEFLALASHIRGLLRHRDPVTA
ncbi:NitT/TauT family transport system ATP-binding protein [Aminobacter niigataensis]|uniref:NitT/TauT family transport system ATP-binding protein n=1 Tax=Aminobacter niigataensis TaxID=83265 RepID=A0ABR6L5Q8_9HYPH|nr:NitT/TauT family transport system ATP-binding protein [Aminobacter niigataensis]